MHTSIPQIIGAIVALYILLLIFGGIRYLSTPIPQTPPLAVRIAGLIEACFGAFFIVISLAVKFGIMPNFLLKMAFHLVGLGWLVLTVQLYKGSPLARKICLGISIARIFTIIGLPVSFLSIWLLYFTKSSKEYFLQKKEKPDKTICNNKEQESAIGQKAVCVTDLKPVGKIDINGKIIQGKSSIFFIEKGTVVKIIEKKRNEYIVEPV